MGRHSSGKNNYAVSANVIVALVVVLALIAGLVWWFWVRDAADGEQAAEGECLQGELTLPVASSSPGLARELTDAWSATDPVVRDHCVEPQLVDGPANAAVYLAADSPATAAELERAGRTATSATHPVVAAVTVGVAGRGQAPVIGDLDAAEVTYPVADQPDAAVWVAAALAGDTAPDLIARDREKSVEDASDEQAPLIAVPENTVPVGYQFTALPETQLPYSAITLNPAGEISEEQTRAAAEFADHAAENADVETDPAGPDLAAVWAAAVSDGTTPAETTQETPTATPAEDPAEEAPVVAATDTLLLLDTSSNMVAPFGEGSFYSTTADVLASVALDLGGQGHSVALWNYSSPINPGVTQGWRRNVNFSDGRNAADAVRRFGTGGVPQTRSAVVAAVGNASDRAAEIGGPVRVLLITSATDQDMDDPTFTAALDQARRGEVILDVIHVGPEGVDPLLTDLADSHTRADTPAELEARVREAAGL